MITKLSLYDSRPESLGTSSIHPVNRLYNTGGLDKTASSLVPELVSYLEGLEDPSEDEARAVITALSAYDTFGPNKNGDAFFREDLLRQWDFPKVGKMPMFETFEHYARPYKHHINKPDSQAYGKVLKAFWNPKMDRVELVVSVDRRLAKDVVERIEGYGDVSTSMGFRAKYDQCLICGNKASRRPDYCHHARRQMLQVLPDGQIVAVRNPEGKFFDISFVIDPADLTSRAVWVNRLGEFGGPIKTASLRETLSIAGEGFKKLAHIAVSEDGPLEVYLSADLACANGICEIIEKEADDKHAEEDKEADIDKEVPAELHSVLSDSDEEIARKAADHLRASEPTFDEAFLKKVASEYSLDDLFSGFFLSGISLKPREAQYIGLAAEGMPKSASILWNKNILVTSEGVDPIDYSVSADTSGSEKVASFLVGRDDVMTERSCHEGWLQTRMDKIANMGMNPFLAQEEATRMHPGMARAILDQRELERYEAEKSRGPLRYLLGLLLGSKWAIRKKQIKEMGKRNPDLLAELALGRGATREDLQAAKHLELSKIIRSQPTPRNASRMVMTAPISNYVRGVESSNMYPDMGMLEMALGKEASNRVMAQEEWNKSFKDFSQAGFDSLVKVAQKTPFQKDDVELWGHESTSALLLAMVAKHV